MESPKQGEHIFLAFHGKLEEGSNDHCTLRGESAWLSSNGLFCPTTSPSANIQNKKRGFCIYNDLHQFFFYLSDFFCQIFEPKPGGVHTHSSTRDTRTSLTVEFANVFFHYHRQTEFHLRHSAHCSMKVNYCINLHPVCVFTCSVRTHGPQCGNHRQEGEIRK